MKKIQIQKPSEDSEEDNVSVSPADRIAKKAKEQHEAALKAAMARIGKSKTGSNPAKGKPSFGSSLRAVDESSDDYYFSMMDSILSEKIIGMLEEKKKIDSSNMISPDAKLSGTTPVVASSDGIPPAQYAQAQGVTGKSKNSMSESKGSEEEHHIDRRMYAMEVPYNQRDKAKAEGMSWHPKKKVWYHRTLVDASRSSFKRSSSKAEPI